MVIGGIGEARIFMVRFLDIVFGYLLDVCCVENRIFHEISIGDLK